MSLPKIVQIQDFTIPPSPTPHLLGTNVLPSRFEAKKIRESLSQIESHATRLDEEIQEVQAALKGLLAKRQRVRQYIEEHTDCLKYSGRLPDELWSEIFFHTLPASNSATISTNLPPILLGRVCSSWRTISISMPRLWSDIRVTIKHDGAASQAQLVCLYLKRSGRRPLSLRIHRADGPDGLTEWMNHPTIQALIRCSSRWRVVDFLFPLTIQASTVFQAIKGNLASLKQLTISSDVDYIDSTPLEVFSEAPLLCNVKTNFSYDFTALRIPYTHLTCFDAWRCSANQVLSVLRQSPELNELSCRTCTEILIPSSIIEHSQLRVLHLARGDSFSLGLILDHLRLPALQCFSMAYWDEWPHAQFRLFLSRSSCELRRVSFESVIGMSADELVDCLQELPSLLELSLSTMFIIPDVLVHLTAIPQLVPKLQAIELNSGLASNGQHLIQLIRSRWEPLGKSSTHTKFLLPPALQSASLSISTASDDSEVVDQLDLLEEEVEKLRADGFRLKGELWINKETMDDDEDDMDLYAYFP